MIKQNIPLQTQSESQKSPKPYLLDSLGRLNTSRHWGFPLDLCDVINQFQEAPLLSREVRGFEHWGYNNNSDSREKNIQMYPKIVSEADEGVEGKRESHFQGQ